MKSNIPQLNSVEVFHENTHSTHYEGEIRDIKINDHSVATLAKLEAQISELKKQLGILFAVTLIAGIASISTGVNGSEMKTKMMVQDESRKIMSQTMNDMRNRVHYMMDVTPWKRTENPYQDYRMQYIPKETPKRSRSH